MADAGTVTGQFRQVTLNDRCGSTDARESAEVELTPPSDLTDRDTRQAGLIIGDNRDGSSEVYPNDCF